MSDRLLMNGTRKMNRKALWQRPSFAVFWGMGLLLSDLVFCSLQRSVERTGTLFCQGCLTIAGLLSLLLLALLPAHMIWPKKHLIRLSTSLLNEREKLKS